MSHLHDLSEQIFEIRGKCTDEEYKNLMDSLKKVYDEQQSHIQQPHFQIPQERQSLELILDPIQQDSIQHTPQNNHNLNKYKNVVHGGVSCDNCNKGPIIGIRYNCLQCSENYDLCQTCFDKHRREKNIHQHTKFGLVVKPQKFNTNCCAIM